MIDGNATLLIRFPVPSRIPGNQVIVEKHDEHCRLLLAHPLMQVTILVYATSWGPVFLKNGSTSLVHSVALADVRTTNFEALGYVYSRRLLPVGWQAQCPMYSSDSAHLFVHGLSEEMMVNNRIFAVRRHLCLWLAWPNGAWFPPVPTHSEKTASGWQREWCRKILNFLISHLPLKDSYNVKRKNLFHLVTTSHNL